ncbi:JAB domain-containing protein [Exiguobacterium sp. CinTr1]
MILSNAAAVVVGHNHPSGNTEPSREDIEVQNV